MDDVVIRANGLSKRYRRGVEKSGWIFEWLRGKAAGENFWALRDVSFEVRRGDMFGIIGRNGAGKSTLLRILSRVTRPNAGHAEIHGRVGSLLEVGTGFHPELTGRENIYLNGSLIGLRKDEIVRNFDQIVEFSGVAQFLDTPIKRYSSGMQIRLGFAIAAHLDQEILLLDEVLSVGDAAFREKSLSRMNDVISSDRTVVFVGHDLSIISSVCNRAIWLENGIVREYGTAAEIAHHYLETVAPDRHFKEGSFSFAERSKGEDRNLLSLTRIILRDGSDAPVRYFKTGQIAKFAICYQAKDVDQLKNFTLLLTILNRRQQPLTVCRYVCQDGLLPSSGEMLCTFPKLPLMPGRYKLNLKCVIGTDTVQRLPGAVEFSVLQGDGYGNQALPPSGSCDSLFDHSWSLRQSSED